VATAADVRPVNETARHFAALAGYGRAEGYLELRWRAPRGMRDSTAHWPPAPNAQSRTGRTLLAGRNRRRHRFFNCAGAPAPDDDRASHSAAAERSLRRPKRKRGLAAARRLELASPAVSLSSRGASVTDQPRVSEMIRVGEEAPPGRDRKQVICRQRVASNVPVDIQRVPAHGREGRPLTKLMGVDCDWAKSRRSRHRDTRP